MKSDEMHVRVAPWSEALSDFGFQDNDLMVEGVSAGTSNYVLAINNAGQPWSAALRLPAPGADLGEFIRDKSTSLPILDALADLLSVPLEVNDHCSVHFEGTSRWVENRTTRDFLTRQADRSHHILDTRNGTERSKRAVNVLSDRKKGEPIGDLDHEHIQSFASPFFMSKGAPASETVEDFPDRAPEVAMALALLHARSEPALRAEASSDAIARIRKEADIAADRWTPAPNSKEDAGLTRMLNGPWGSDPTIAKREAWLRSSGGRQQVRSLTREIVSARPNEGTFVHGDAHGGNFVIVDYEYDADVSLPLDREFINSAFRADAGVSELFLVKAENSAVLISASKPAGTAVCLKRRKHFEVHPIDFDDATFGSGDPTFLDAATLALSSENISKLCGGQVWTTQVIIDSYMDALER